MLHIISKASLLNDPMVRISDYIQPSDTILLIQDAIYVAYQNNAQISDFIALGGDVCILKPDAVARGMSSTGGNSINYIDFKGFVELTARYETSLSW